MGFSAILRQENRAVQSEGWQFNSDVGLRLSPDTEGEIKLPLDTLKVDVTDSPEPDVTFRAGKLYNRRKATYQFDQPMTLDVITLIPFNDLPTAAQDYVRCRAGRKFLNRVIGTSDSLSYSAKDEKDARGVLEADEESQADRSIFDSSAYSGLGYGRRTVS